MRTSSELGDFRSARSAPGSTVRGRAALLLAFRQTGILSLRAAAIGFPVALMVFAVVSYPIFGTPTAIGTDSSNYYAAGLRLNSGHELYAIVPGDREVLMAPPYWAIPLMAPPPIAVFWRAPALLGDVSMLLWWVASIVAIVGTVVYIALRGRPGALAFTCLVSPALAFSAVSGNANSFLLPALIASWTLRDRAPRLSGGMIALASAIKLAPALLAVWLLIRPYESRRRNLLGLVAGGAVIVALSLAGAGIDAHFGYLAALRQPGTGAATAMSLPGLLAGAGLPATIAALSIPALVLATLGGAIALRRHERWSFALLAVGAALATPAVSLSTFALLAVCVAPWLDRRTRATSTFDMLPGRITPRIVSA